MSVLSCDRNASPPRLRPVHRIMSATVTVSLAMTWWSPLLPRPASRAEFGERGSPTKEVGHARVPAASVSQRSGDGYRDPVGWRQRFGQALAGAEQLGLHRAGRHSELLGDLADGQVEEVEEDAHLPLPEWKRADGIQHLRVGQL